MSHFTVLVVGEDPEAQLAGYHEFECTGLDDEYVQDIDETEDKKKDYEQYREDGQSFEEYLQSEGFKPVAFGTEPDKESDHKYSYYTLDETGDVEKVFDRTNPNAKWDWYSLGGRWTGYFKLKRHGQGEIGRPGLMTERAKEGYVDSAIKRDIDFEAMKQERKEKAEKDWDDYSAALKGEKHIPFSVFYEKHPNEIDKARDEYNAQQSVKNLRAERYFFDTDSYGDDKQAYVDRQVKSYLSTFAVVKDSKWHEKGKMGWWACVSDEKDTNVWHQQFHDLIDDLPDNTRLSVYDCHI